MAVAMTAAADAQNAASRRNVSHGVVTIWEHIEGLRCAYVHMAGGKWCRTQIVVALDGFATLGPVCPQLRKCLVCPGSYAWCRLC